MNNVKKPKYPKPKNYLDILREDKYYTKEEKKYSADCFKGRTVWTCTPKPNQHKQTKHF